MAANFYNLLRLRCIAAHNTCEIQNSINIKDNEMPIASNDAFSEKKPYAPKTSL